MAPRVPLDLRETKVNRVSLVLKDHLAQKEDMALQEVKGNLVPRARW